MKFTDLRINTTVPEEVKQQSRAMYDSMKERDALKLRHLVLQSLIETMAIQLLEDGNTTIPQIDESISAVVEGIIKDDRITVAEGEQMKATAIKAVRHHRHYGDLFLSLATTRVAMNVDKKAFTPEVQMSMESFTTTTQKMNESGRKVMETAVYAAAERLTVEYREYFPISFLNLIK